MMKDFRRLLMFHGTDNSSTKHLSNILHDNVYSFCLGKKKKTKQNIRQYFAVTLVSVQSFAFLTKIALSARDYGFRALNLVILSKATCVFHGFVPSKVRRGQCSYANENCSVIQAIVSNISFPSYLQCLHGPFMTSSRRQTRRQPYLSCPYLNQHNTYLVSKYTAA